MLKSSLRLTVGLSCVCLGLILFTFFFLKSDFIENIAINIFLLSVPLIIIGLFFIIMSFIFK